MKRTKPCAHLIGLVGLAFVVAGVLTANFGSITAAGGATVSIVPNSQNVDVGETFTVDVTINDATNLAAYEFRITYDATILSVVNTVGTDFLRSTGRGSHCPTIGKEADDTTTDVWFGCATINLDSGPPVNGSGVAGRVTFSAVKPGVTSLTFVKVELADDQSNDCCSPISVNEAAVRVIGPGETPEGPPSTPTRDPYAMTPTADPSRTAPTPAAGSLTPQPGQTPLSRLVDPDSGMVWQGGSRSGGSGSGGSGNAGASDGQSGSSRGSPRAGTGPEENGIGWPTLAGWTLALTGAALISSSVYIGKTRRVSRSREL